VVAKFERAFTEFLGSRPDATLAATLEALEVFVVPVETAEEFSFTTTVTRS
jgi:hypothetical protein